MFYGYVMAAGVLGIFFWLIRQFDARAHKLGDIAMLVLFVILAVWGLWVAVQTC